MALDISINISLLHCALDCLHLKVMFECTFIRDVVNGMANGTGDFSLLGYLVQNI